MPYIICATRSTTHIQGIPERTTGPATDNSATTGVVGYYATSACAAISRSGHTMRILTANADLASALEDARDACKFTGRKLCKNCERAALRAIEDAKQAEPAAPATPTTYAEALAALPAGTDVQLYTSSGQTITGTLAGTGTDGAMVAGFVTGRRRQVSYAAMKSFQFFDHDADDGAGAWVDPITDAAAAAWWATMDERERADLADNASEANQSEPACAERITVDGIGYPCTVTGDHAQHATALGNRWVKHGTEYRARAVPGSVDDVTRGYAYTDARNAYRRAADRFEETGDAADQLAADDAWGTFLAAADAAGKCRVFTCYADTEPGETTCRRHGTEAAAAEAEAPSCSCSNGLCEDCASEYRGKLDALADRHRAVQVNVGGLDFTVCAACSTLVKLVAPDHPGVAYPCDDAKMMNG